MPASIDLPYTRGQALPDLLRQRILILDGAMGTALQQQGMTEADYRGARFAHHPVDLRHNVDLLNLTQPERVLALHRAYLDAGADIVCTNTYGGTAIAQADFGLVDAVAEINVAAARLACRARDAATTSDRPRFVAGAIGPTPRTASLGADADDPAARGVDFDTLVQAYREQADALLDGGVDLLLVETIFDTLNAKAAVFAIDDALRARGERVPLILSGTVVDASGRTLSGQTVGAFWHSLRHAQPLAVGLNCSMGAALMRPYVEELSRLALDCFISCHPNAGLPNPMSETGFDETPDVTAGLLQGLADRGWLNLAGGCCGTTPEHVRAIAVRLRACAPRQIGVAGT